MPRMIFTESELQRVDRVCKEHDPATHPLTAPHLKRCDLHAFGYLVGFMTRAVRGELVAGLILRGAMDAAVLQGVLTPLAATSFIDIDFDNRYGFGLPETPTSSKDYWRRAEWQYGMGFHVEEFSRAMLCMGVLNPAIGNPKTPPVRDDGWQFLCDFYRLLDLAHGAMFGRGRDHLQVVGSEEH